MYLTTLERIVLESLAKGSKNQLELHLDTGIESQVLDSILDTLNDQMFILKVGSRFEYFDNNQQITIANKEENICEEFKEITSSAISKSVIGSDKSSFRLLKVFLDSKEQKILFAKFKDIENFLKDAHQQKRPHYIREQTLVYWGGQAYGDVVEFMCKN